MVIKKIKEGWRIYSRSKHFVKGKWKRKNLGTFKTKEAAKKHEKEIQYFKRKKK